MSDGEFMITFETSANVPDDRKVTLNLPDESPTGNVRLIVTIESPLVEDRKIPRSSLAEWAEQNAEEWGEALSSEDVERFTGRSF